MKQSFLALTTLVLMFSGVVFSVCGQEDLLKKVVRLEKTHGKVEALLKEIGQKGNFVFSYSPHVIQADKEITLSTDEQRVSAFLEEICQSYAVQYFQRGNKIIIAKKKKPINNQQKATLNGYIREAGSGEALIGATVQVRAADGPDHHELLTGVVTNAYGFYSITLPVGAYKFVFSFIGYEPVEEMLFLEENTSLKIELKEATGLLQEVVVEASPEEYEDENVRSTDLGKTHLNIQEIKQIPALIGEVDVVKAIQLLPGVQVQGEGSTNFFVRGGAADQNLILLDEAPVYNASHLMGFFSVFNPDAIKNMQFYRGSIPAAYGGRLSSLLDIRMKEGNLKNFSVSGGIGLTSSRLTIEGPIKKEKSSFIISARRTYADLFLKFSRDEFTRNSALYFYDLNAKFNYKIDEKNKIYLSGYFGRDLNKFKTLQYVIDWGNATGTMRWNHLFNERLFSNTTLIYSRYDYLIDLSNEGTPFNWRSEIKDHTLKMDFSYYVNPDNLLGFGFSTTYHRFRPGESKDAVNGGVPRSNALEHAAYISNEQHIGDKLSLEYGLRYALFQLIGPTSVISYDENYLPVGTEEFEKGEIYKTFRGLEPRVSARYLLSGNSAVKVSYNRQRQYMQLLSNLALGLNAFDIWLPSSAQTPPQTSDAFSVGYFLNPGKNLYEFSVEGYYRILKNQIDYKDHGQLIMNPFLEGELRRGEARAYGIELMLRKREGRFTGWLSYTLSKAKRKIPGINNGQYYPANYDQPHSFSLVGNYKLSKRWGVSANFVYATGRPVTLPVETFRYEDFIVPVYGNRNSGRMPDYHRLDLAATLYPKEKPNRVNHSSWTFSLYNAYARYNAAAVFVSNELEDIDLVKDPDKSAFHKLSIFGIVPSITYNFKF
ncbi:TonB-dependent receptor [Fulvivirgaceae bacterium BMA12]|uniref:TonB-dependent receptor n=1 Tax=Agaribacillus aureus TaxID=3051825 RepID=A0ABT8LF02_9BACT|nr:TonB-dependent receptor [Fulvivirgaceae bacterium BMA12]